MTEIDVLLAGIAVRDFDRAVDWYARLLGRPADLIVKDDEVMWRFADHAWMYVVRDEQRAGHALVALAVAALDKTVAHIEGRGITGRPIELVGDAGRKASFTDADGNTVSFIEVRTPTD